MFLQPDDPLKTHYMERPICGIDEAGRGPWAGPVVAAAVVWPERLSVPEALDDSKNVSKDKREQLYDYITRNTDYGVGITSVYMIDELNILNATKIAMHEAFLKLQTTPKTALVDGNQPPNLPCTTISVIKGDSRVVAIAAASIIAKVTRDRMMHELSEIFPGYGWDTNAGYGTKKHQEAIARFGVTEHHRRSFAPIKAALKARQAEEAVLEE